MREKPQEPSEALNDPYGLLIQETQNDPGLTDEQKLQRIAALREGQADEKREAFASIVSLKLRRPVRGYAPELVAQIAATLFRDDYGLAVAQALRLLDTSYQILERHKKERSRQCWMKFTGKPEERVPFGEAMKRITGQKSPRRAEERYIARLLREEYAYTDHHEFMQANGSRVQNGHDPLARPKTKTRKLTREEIDAILAPYRKEGFTVSRVEQLREGYRERTSRVRARNFQKKRATPKKVA